MLTHALGLVAFLVASANFVANRPVRLVGIEAALVALFVVGCSFTLLASTGYHLFLCVGGRATYDKLYSCDLVGIVSSILTSFYIALWAAFRCSPTVRVGYCVMITLVCGWLGAVTSVPALRDNFALATSSFVGAVASSVFPVGHYFVANWSHGLFEIDTGSRITVGILANLGCYAVGLVFYISKAPERFAPGAFDYWLHSHQVWHFFVFLGPVCMLYAVDPTIGHMAGGAEGNDLCCSAVGATFATEDACLATTT